MGNTPIYILLQSRRLSLYLLNQYLRLCSLSAAAIASSFFGKKNNAPLNEIDADARLEALLTTQQDEDLIKTQQLCAQSKFAKELPPITMAQNVLNI